MVEALPRRSAATASLRYPARDLLAEMGLRVTQPRLALAELLFGKGFRHVSAESLCEELVRSAQSATSRRCRS